MNRLNRCQCGAKPSIVKVHAPKTVTRPRMGRMRDNVRERAVCEFCGNATGIHHNRADLRRDWNSAGWCGQSEALGTGVPA